MKKIFLIVSLVCTCSAIAQKPETVHSVVKERREVSWYELQQKLWKEEVDKNKQNANAYYNYYATTRALKNVCNVDSEKETIENRAKYQAQCDQIIDAAMKDIPNTFEANYMKYWNGGLMSDPSYLLKAYELNPKDVRTYDELMLHYEINRDVSNYEKFAVKMFEYNELPASILNWGYNVLSELDENAIIFTAGDNDTYAAWIVQEAKKFRKDVRVINTYMITIDEYRNKLFKEMGLLELKVSFENIKTSEEKDKNFNVIVQHLVNSKRPVYLASTALAFFEKDWSEKLFLTGLAYKFSETPIDNLSVIRRNYEKRYLLDHLREQFSYNIADKISDDFNATYLASMLKLYKHYEESEEFFKMKELENLILKISENSGQQSEVFEVMNDTKTAHETNFMMSLLDVKKLEKEMITVSGKVNMSNHEVTNLDYRIFLDNLIRSKQFDLYKSSVYDSAMWVNQFPTSSQKPMMDLYHSHEAYNDYPVVNISHDAAKLYCEWLTKQYNMQRKRKYTQVIFRLPTEKEWLAAAGSGNMNAVTCFPKDDIFTSSKCYLANIKPENGNYGDDGAFHTTKVYNYNPNVLGFYCMFGNVSEMIDVDGIAKGGSWYNTFDECKFQNQINYTKPDAGIGFRIIMEVIEE